MTVVLELYDKQVKTIIIKMFLNIILEHNLRHIKKYKKPQKIEIFKEWNEILKLKNNK